MSEVTKVTYKIKNLSDAPISFVGLHTLSIPGASEAEYSLSEAAWKKLLPRIRAKKTLVVTKAGAEEATAAAATTATTTSTKTTKSTTSTKTSTKSTTTKDAASTTSTATSATTSTDAATETSTDATTSTKEG